jgi:hypothetical protein
LDAKILIRNRQGIQGALLWSVALELMEALSLSQKKNRWAIFLNSQKFKIFQDETKVWTSLGHRRRLRLPCFQWRHLSVPHHQDAFAIKLTGGAVENVVI